MSLADTIDSLVRERVLEEIEQAGANSIAAERHRANARGFKSQLEAEFARIIREVKEERGRRGNGRME